MKLPAWLLALLGLANEATDEQVKSKVTDLLARPESTALANEQTRATSAEGKVADLTSQLSALNSQLAESATALANERAAHAATATARNESLVAAAVAAGRITEAQKPVWLTRLGRDFATESTALANEKPGAALKVTARTGALATRAAASEPAQQFHALVNARTAKGESFESAWQAVKATPDGKALFAKMSEPAA